MLQSFASKRGKLVAQRGQTESERSIGGLLLFVYHCFDRIVNYLSGLSRPEQVEGYFTDGVILGSQGFVESHFLRLKQTLGYRRHNAATHLTALGSPGLWVFRATCRSGRSIRLSPDPCAIHSHCRSLELRTEIFVESRTP